MAFTVTHDGNVLGGGKSGLYTSVGTIAGPASYATGGLAADVATDFSITAANIVSVNVTNDKGYGCSWDSSTAKILAFYDSSATTGSPQEVAATTDISTVTFTAEISFSAP